MAGTTFSHFQTDRMGQPVNQIYFEETCDIDKEFYLSAVVDRASQKVMFIASPAGGMNIEEVAQIHRTYSIKSS